MAVRPIDAEKYMELLKEQYLHHKSMGNSQAAKAWQGAMQLLHDMPTLTPPNEPLTLDELREMDGQPVWDENGKCYLVDTTYRFCSCSDIEIAIMDKNGDVKRYPQRRALYRRPPEGEEDIK